MSKYLESIAFASSVFAVVILIWRTKINDETMQTDCCVEYYGSCHCGSITFSIKAPRKLVVWRCDCSICEMKKNEHFIIPEKNLILLSGGKDITQYQFNTNTARHYFCSICGVQSYYRPRSNPDGVAVTFSCLKNYKVSQVCIKKTKLYIFLYQ